MKESSRLEQMVATDSSLMDRELSNEDPALPEVAGSKALKSGSLCLKDPCESRNLLGRNEKVTLGLGSGTDSKPVERTSSFDFLRIPWEEAEFSGTSGSVWTPWVVRFPLFDMSDKVSPTAFSSVLPVNLTPFLKAFSEATLVWTTALNTSEVAGFLCRARIGVSSPQAMSFISGFGGSGGGGGGGGSGTGSSTLLFDKWGSAEMPLFLPLASSVGGFKVDRDRRPKGAPCLAAKSEVCLSKASFSFSNARRRTLELGRGLSGNRSNADYFIAPYTVHENFKFVLVKYGS